MKKVKKIVIPIIIVVILIVCSIFVYYNYFYDSNKLSIREKEWINSNANKVISFGIPTNLNNFSKSGTGIFYDFTKDLADEYKLKVNNNSYTSFDNSLGFYLTSVQNDNDLLFYKDFYVLVSKDDKVVTDINQVKDAKVGTISDYSSFLTSNTTFSGTISLATNKESLLKDFATNYDYIFVPLNEYLDEIVSNNYKVVYQFENIPIYYYLHLGTDTTFNGVVKKYYNEWMNNSLEEYYYKHLFSLYKTELSLTDLEIDSFNKNVYSFGFVTKSPLISGNSSKIGGIIAEYLKEFSKLTNAEFKYVAYKNNSDLEKAYNNKKIDLLFNDTTNYENSIKTNISEKFVIISNNKVSDFYANLNMINNKNVCVIENSNLFGYLSSFSNINIDKVKNEQKLIRCLKKNKLVAIDEYTLNYYSNDSLNDYHVVYSGYNTNNFSFKYKSNDDAFYKVFNSYINTLGNKEMMVRGLTSYVKMSNVSNIVISVAKYILIISGVGILVAGIIVYSKKKVKLNTRISKDEKLKFVDMMTSLKNRNYLNERIEIWNQNTIYPQAIIVIDLNNVKYLNDTFGHEEGDKQIMAAANVLHQNQLDNTEIMRTDGNEFMIYLVGYNEKQVVNYIKKLVKEFGNLPYDYGAAIGFSMIVDDLKLIDDAINEASLLMRENKETEYNENEKQD